MKLETSFNDKILEIIFESSYYGTVIVDSDGNIKFMSKNYCAFLGKEQSQVVGQHVTDVIENTRMHLVAQIGSKEIADLQFLKGTFVIANRIPILENGTIIGAIGTIIYRDLHEWKSMNDHIQDLLSEYNLYPPEPSKTNGARYSLDDLIGISSEIHNLKEKVMLLAKGNISVLIRGESGTGKEIIAHSIHQNSERSDKPFIKVNCGAIPMDLLESELFGYEEGSFTGAKRGGKPGKFQIADGGSIFLDEIGDMPQYLQVKLLRVLQEKEIEPVGATEPKKIDVRVIAATSRSLEELLDEGTFRKDLYYRINAVELYIPPLRERPEDISVIVKHLLKKVTARINKRVVPIDSNVMSLLEQYNWPGNVRELENVIEAAVHLTNNDNITADDLPEYIVRAEAKERGLKQIVEDTEIMVIEKHLKRFNFDKRKVAGVLGIGYSTLYEKMKKYGIKLYR
ncbi:sigma-54 interaction domain-containing protein [Lentibacillus jeotgali]|uniref:sigma-54 interaction domain-containing protein n=1 Tax=Lentibacillus jeotgali TaxID=558169 RepID=UPI000262745D|nr:sigma-54-dependent Fis family transcriptional regulator [Lentibacillus jeotgali]